MQLVQGLQVQIQYLIMQDVQQLHLLVVVVVVFHTVMDQVV